MVPRIGVLLSGCGVMDGSEIHEATLTLYFLDKYGADAVCMAPDKNQADVVDHIAGAPVSERRNVLTEAARIARGKIRDVSAVTAEELDGIILPGGYGAAKNLCTFAADGPDCTVDPAVARLLRALWESRKPIGALCIAPVILAALFGTDAVRVTIGRDAATASALAKMGARHEIAATEEIVVDERHNVVSTPCYMTAQSIKELGEGIEKLVGKIIALAGAAEVKTQAQR